MYHQRNARMIKARKTRPPTTPPAMAPALVVWPDDATAEGVEVEEVDGDVVGACVLVSLGSGVVELDVRGRVVPARVVVS